MERNDGFHEMALLHQQTREFVRPLSRHCVRFRFRTAASDVVPSLLVWHRGQDPSTAVKFPAQWTAREAHFDWYEANWRQHDTVHYLRYVLVLEKDGEVRYFHPLGLTDTLDPDSFFEFLWANERDGLDQPDWITTAVWYQIFPERFQATGRRLELADWDSDAPSRENFFGGTLAGILERFDHLVDLGVTALYLTPVFKAPSNHKYDTEDYLALDPNFGTLDDLKALVNRAHAEGMKVVLDGVFNHCGATFGPFQEALADPTSPYRQWFFFREAAGGAGYECVGDYKFMPKLRTAHPEVASYFCEVAQRWMARVGIDGWRLDVADEVESLFWQRFRSVVKAQQPQAVLLAETWKEAPDMLRGDQMDSVMNYPFRNAVRDFFALRKTEASAFLLRMGKLWATYPAEINAGLYNLLGSHDTPRFLTECGGDKARLRAALFFQFTYPGAPAVYYGDEFAMEGANDPDDRRPMRWRDGDRELYRYVKDLIALRKKFPVLSRGKFVPLAAQGMALAWACLSETEAVYLVLNPGEGATFTLPLLSFDQGRHPVPVWGAPESMEFREVSQKLAFVPKNGTGPISGSGLRLELAAGQALAFQTSFSGGDAMDR